MKTSKLHLIKLAVICAAFILPQQSFSQKPWYLFDKSSSPRWSSFENITAEKGKGGMENNGAKGHPSNGVEANLNIAK